MLIKEDKYQEMMSDHTSIYSENVSFVAFDCVRRLWVFTVLSKSHMTHKQQL